MHLPARDCVKPEWKVPAKFETRIRSIGRLD